MGRRKIAIEPLTDERNRSVTFLKRKAGLFKKAHELAVLCQIDIAVIIVGRNKKLYEFSSADIEELIGKYRQTQPHESKGPKDFDPSFRKSSSASTASRTRGAARDDGTDEEDDEEEEDDELLEDDEAQMEEEQQVSVQRDNSPRNKPKRANRRSTSRGSSQSSIALKNEPGVYSQMNPEHRPATSIGDGASKFTHVFQHKSSHSLGSIQQAAAMNSTMAAANHPPMDIEQYQLHQQQLQFHQHQHQHQQQQPQQQSHSHPNQPQQQFNFVNQRYPYSPQRNHHRSASSMSNSDVSPGISTPNHLPQNHPPSGEYGVVPGPPYMSHDQDAARRASDWQMFGMVQQRSQSADIGPGVAPVERRFYSSIPSHIQEHSQQAMAQHQHQQQQQQQQQQHQQQQQQQILDSKRDVFNDSQQMAGNRKRSPVMMNKYSPASTTSSNGMRPKLKVQIPMGDSGESQISSSEPSRDTAANAPRGGEDSSEIRTPGGSKDNSGASSAGGHNGSHMNNGPNSAGPSSGGPWGSSLLLPPPSPSTYLSNGGSNATVGPGNPFGRPPLVNSNGEQTPLSAALPSKYVHDLLPSPSNFYGSEWNTQFGPPSALGYGPTSAGLGSAFPGGQVSSQPIGMGISLLGTRGHLTSDMLPSPLQFGSTPIVGSASQSLGDLRTSPPEKKRESSSGSDVGGSSSKRLKVGSSSE